MHSYRLVAGRELTLGSLAKFCEPFISFSIKLSSGEQDLNMPFSLFPFSDIKMAELKVEIPERFIEMIGDELKKSDTKVLLRNAVEEKLKLLLLFKAVNDILKDSKLSDNDFSKLVEEYRDNLAKRYGIS